MKNLSKLIKATYLLKRKRYEQYSNIPNLNNIKILIKN